MNANELADKLMSSLTMEYDCDEYMEQAATMLRQQQTEIEALKARPQYRELSDEEMKDLIEEYWGSVEIVDPEGFLHEIKFIKAILKKASDK